MFGSEPKKKAEEAKKREEEAAKRQSLVLEEFRQIGAKFEEAFETAKGSNFRDPKLNSKADEIFNEADKKYKKWQEERKKYEKACEEHNTAVRNLQKSEKSKPSNQDKESES